MEHCLWITTGESPCGAQSRLACQERLYVFDQATWASGRMLGLLCRTAVIPMPQTQTPSQHVIIIGGPAELMAAEMLGQDPGRPLRRHALGRPQSSAGVGVNITHSEPHPQFLARYAERAPCMAPLLRQFGAKKRCANGYTGWGLKPLSAAPGVSY